MSKRKTIHYTLCGLEYVYLVDAPIGKDGKEEFIDLSPEEIDRMIAVEIIRQKVPLRGKEVLFLRKALKMNRNRWAEKLGVTASGILRWEETGEKRMSKINEAAIRMLCAEELGIKLDPRWSSLATAPELPERLEVAA
jgi:DNA-binding transcriptional regulator YiaG